MTPALPSSASSGLLGFPGEDGEAGLVGLDPLPEPAAPPLLIITSGAPEIDTPAGPISIKLAPALSDS